MSDTTRRRTITGLRAALGLMLLGGAVATGLVARELASLRGAPDTKTVPRELMRIQLARSCDEVGRILEEWRTKSRVEAVKDALGADEKLIRAYTVTLASATSLALWGAGVSPWGVALGTVAALAAGAFDHFENIRIGKMLAGESACQAELGWFRLFAQVKFILLLGVGLAIIVAGGTALRNRLTGGWRRTETGPRDRFLDLMLRETCGLFHGSRAGKRDEPHVDAGPSGEPWVQRRCADLTGLALSGGGIRSATFNLGFLQGLAKLGLLELVDYVSTVSGGGYVGSFWSAWLARPAREQDPGLFPASPAGRPNDEPAEVRHLREFSGFLSARVGFFEQETWQAVVSIVAGLVPAVLAALSVLGLGIVGWLALMFFLACPHWAGGTAMAVLLTVVALVWFEKAWAEGAGLPDDEAKRSRRIYAWGAGISLVLVAMAQSLLPFAYRFLSKAELKDGWKEGLKDGLPVWLPTLRTAGKGYDAWWSLVGLAVEERTWFFSPRLFDPTLVWFTVALLLLVVRAPFAVCLPEREHRVAVPAFDRAVMRLLGAGVLWAALATLWHVSVNARMATRLLGATVASGALFALLRNWIGVSLRPRPTRGVLDGLKPYLPQVIAYLTMILAVAGVGALLVDACGADWFCWWLATAVMTLFVSAILFFDPAEFGMHGFYRDRICRAYPGASNPDPHGDNRQTDLREGDDLDLTTLPCRPLHLVCCAANDLSGDPIETLSRGARSAVLSRWGVSVGPHVAPVRTSLGGAVTASAAAFNSNMGTISIAVGPAVGFLMTALNLRLGLWVRNPKHETGKVRPLPGVLFYREMFGMTDAASARPEIHLSDGGHFENLALYELVRRHCRYVIVSDCGEDTDVAFDDFGNASRRIRDDFGVDIEIDLRPLRPGDDGRSRQHMAVGTIHYTEFDKGILVYVKPALTGDESPDVLQYRARNARFPHEPTTDQFYDEAQWESYRRLGEHTATMELGFVRDFAYGTPPSDWVFTTARQERYPTPAWLPERALAMTSRFGTLEAELQETSASMLHEVFPELAALVPGAPAADDADAQPANLMCILRVTQLMEDVYASCELGTRWEHPLNMGWTNCFARWATSPTFRTWWPIIEPMYGNEFGRFLKQRFPVLRRDADAAGVHWKSALTQGDVAQKADSLAWRWWKERAPKGPDVGEDATVYGYELIRPNGANEVHLQVAVAIVHVHGEKASWTSDEFYVPPSLWGAGIGGAFMHRLVGELTAKKVKTCEVTVQMPRGDGDAATRADRVGFIEFYKRHRFRLTEERAATQQSGAYAMLTLTMSEE